MKPISIREYKKVALDGGTLIVSIPHVGDGNVLVTDYLLESAKMDHVAALDSESFPPIAVLRKGKARCPVRVHADVARKIAVLRGEFSPSPSFSRPIAKAILEWATAKDIPRIIALDGVFSTRAGADESEASPVWFASTGSDARKTALDASIPELRDGVLGGVPAILLLEARFQPVEVLVLLAELRGPLDSARSVVAFAHALTALLPGLDLDARRLETELQTLETSVRTVREGTKRMVEHLARSDEQVPMYG